MFKLMVTASVTVFICMYNLGLKIMLAAHISNIMTYSCKSMQKLLSRYNLSYIWHQFSWGAALRSKHACYAC